MDAPNITADEYEERKQELLQATKERKRELDEQQREILNSIEEEHGGDLIETPVSITGDHQATISTILDGSVINRLTAIEETVDAYEQDPESVGVRDIERSMDQAATLLADVIEEAEYDKDLFYRVYDSGGGPEAVGTLIERVFSAIEQEQERQRGAVDGFRQE